MASASRSSAGVEQITKVRKLYTFETSGERVIFILSSGNLATTQSVVTEFKQGFTRGNPTSDLAQAGKLTLLSFDATIRSNLSVSPPIDLLCYPKVELAAQRMYKFNIDNEYWLALRVNYSARLLATVEELPSFPQ